MFTKHTCFRKLTSFYRYNYLYRVKQSVSDGIKCFKVKMTCWLTLDNCWLCEIVGKHNEGNTLDDCFINRSWLIFVVVSFCLHCLWISIKYLLSVKWWYLRKFPHFLYIIYCNRNQNRISICWSLLLLVSWSNKVEINTLHLNKSLPHIRNIHLNGNLFHRSHLKCWCIILLLIWILVLKWI